MIRPALQERLFSPRLFFSTISGIFTAVPFGFHSHPAFPSHLETLLKHHTHEAPTWERIADPCHSVGLVIEYHETTCCQPAF